MFEPPRIWEDVPGAIRRALEQPFRKTAELMPGLETASDVLGWRAGEINSNWGGPRPVTNLLIGSALGSLGGWGVGRLAEQILPERYFDKEALRRRAMIAGAALGGLPAAWQASQNIRETGDPMSVFDKWPAPAASKEAAEVWRNGGQDLFEPTIHRDTFNQSVWSDPFTPPRIQGATTGMVEAASAIRGGSDYVSPFDVARIAFGAGTGLVSGVIAGKALGMLAGLTPEAQKKIQDIGLWSGVLKSVIPGALGLR